MRIDSVTNNMYGKYGVGPEPTVVEKKPVEAKHKKYLDRKPLLPYEEGEGVVKYEPEKEEEIVETVDETEDPAEDDAESQEEKIEEE